MRVNMRNSSFQTMSRLMASSTSNAVLGAFMWLVIVFSIGICLGMVLIWVRVLLRRRNCPNLLDFVSQCIRSHSKSVGLAPEYLLRLEEMASSSAQSSHVDLLESTLIQERLTSAMPPICVKKVQPPSRSAAGGQPLEWSRSLRCQKKDSPFKRFEASSPRHGYLSLEVGQFERFSSASSSLASAESSSSVFEQQGDQLDPELYHQDEDPYLISDNVFGRGKLCFSLFYQETSSRLYVLLHKISHLPIDLRGPRRNKFYVKLSLHNRPSVSCSSEGSNPPIGSPARQQVTKLQLTHKSRAISSLTILVFDETFTFPLDKSELDGATLHFTVKIQKQLEANHVLGEVTFRLTQRHMFAQQQQHLVACSALPGPQRRMFTSLKEPPDLLLSQGQPQPSVGDFTHCEIWRDIVGPEIATSPMKVELLLSLCWKVHNELLTLRVHQVKDLQLPTEETHSPANLFLRVLFSHGNKTLKSKRTRFLLHKENEEYHFRFRVQGGVLRGCLETGHSVTLLVCAARRSFGMSHVLGKVMLGSADYVEGEGALHWQEAVFEKPGECVYKWHRLE